MVVDWLGDLEEWLAPFLAALRHKTRMLLCPAHIAGLIGPGDRKRVSIGVQTVPPIGAQKGPTGELMLGLMLGAGFALLVAQGGRSPTGDTRRAKQFFFRPFAVAQLWFLKRQLSLPASTMSQ